MAVRTVRLAGRRGCGTPRRSDGAGPVQGPRRGDRAGARHREHRPPGLVGTGPIQRVTGRGETPHREVRDRSRGGHHRGVRQRTAVAVRLASEARRSPPTVGAGRTACREARRSPGPNAGDRDRRRGRPREGSVHGDGRGRRTGTERAPRRCNPARGAVPDAAADGANGPGTEPPGPTRRGPGTPSRDTGASSCDRCPVPAVSPCCGDRRRCRSWSAAGPGAAAGRDRRRWRGHVPAAPPGGSSAGRGRRRGSPVSA